MDDATDIALVAIASSWAHWLAAHKDFEPDWTWVQVVAGVTLCLSHARLNGWWYGGDWREQERRIFRAFLLAGTPIIAGEIAQWLQVREARRRLVKLLHGEG